MALWKILCCVVVFVGESLSDHFETLVAHRLPPREFGCINSAWDRAVRADEECAALLGTEKPSSTDSNLTSFKDTQARSPPLPRDDYIFEQLDDEHERKGLEGPKPTEMLPFRDVVLLKMQMMDRGIVSVTDFDSDYSPRSDHPHVLCGAYNGGTMSSAAYEHGAVSLTAVDNEESVDFAADLRTHIRNAVNYWSNLPNLGEAHINGESLVKQVFDEVYRKARSARDVPSGAEASFLLAKPDGDNLRVMKAGNGANFMLFRRSPRSRFERYPFMSTFSTANNRLKAAGSAAPAEAYTLPIFKEDMLLFLPSSVTDHLYTREIASIVTRSLSPKDSGTAHSMEKAVVAARQEVPWILPKHVVPQEIIGDKEQLIDEKVAFTTKPEVIAKMLVLAAKQQAASKIPGPSQLGKFKEGSGSAASSDEGAAVVCWVVEEKQKHDLETLWNVGDFVKGVGHKAMVEALNATG